MASNLLILVPEIAVVTIVAVLALLEIFLPPHPPLSPLGGERIKGEGGNLFFLKHAVNFVGIIFVALALVRVFTRTGTAFDGMFVSDPFAVFFKLIFLGTAAAVFLMSGAKEAEFHLLLWSTLLGMFFLVSSNNFLLFFVSLELLTLSLYILAAWSKQDLLSIEAGLKYLVLGSLASAFLLYGISLIYASSGTISFEELGKFVGARLVPAREGQTQGLPLLFQAGVLLVLSALGFKVASVPFHVWVPDVYEGAPTPVVAFFSVASKSAGFAALLRVLFTALAGWGGERRVLFSLFAAMTLLYGNLGALVQTDMKRLLGYSSIGHAGFLLIALAARPEAATALLYYLIAYAVTHLSVFLVVSVVENSDGSHTIAAFKGLARRSPFLGAGMFVALLSLAGVPPLGGFFAKFFILLSAARSGLFWLVILGAINVAVSLYYYLSVVRVVYFEKPARDSLVAVSFPLALLLTGLLIAIVLVGVWQPPFFRAASLAALSIQ